MGIDFLKSNIKNREKKANYIANNIKSNKSDRIRIIEVTEGGIYWRLNILVKYGRNQILNQLLQESVLISSWFPSIDFFFEGDRGTSRQHTPVSDKIGDQILNLWVSSQADDRYISSLLNKL